MKPRSFLAIVLCVAGFAFPASAETYSASDLLEGANAERQVGRLGSAILGYERAALLAPRDPAIVRNLAAVREEAGITVPAVPAWQRPAHWLGFDELAILASTAAFGCGLLLLGSGLLPASFRRRARVISAVLAATAVVSGSAVGLRWTELDRAVVIGTEPVARLAPADSSAIACQLAQGEVVRAEGTYGDFVRVRTFDGQCGWVAARDVEKVIPKDA